MIERFGEEDLSKWPCWSTLGRAYALLGDKVKAEAEFTAAARLDDRSAHACRFAGSTGKKDRLIMKRFPNGAPIGDVLGLTLLAATNLSADESPNILLLLSDDHSVPHVGCFPGGAN